MMKFYNVLVRVLFPLCSILSFILLPLFISNTLMNKKFDVVMFCFFIFFLLGAIVGFVLYFLSLNELDRSPCRYMKKQFKFLLKKGYHLKFKETDDERIYTFMNDKIAINVKEDQKKVCVDFNRIGDKEKIDAIKAFDQNTKANSYQSLSLLDQVDYLSKMVENNYQTIDKYFQDK